MNVVEGIAPGQIGDVDDRMWTCIAASTTDEAGEEQVVPEEVGKRVRRRRAVFAFRDQAEQWLDGQVFVGFTERRGPAPIATRYFGPTDSPSNAWAVEVEQEVAA